MVAAVLDALDVEDVLVAGHSFGADVALALAAISPRVGSLVLIGQACESSPIGGGPGSPRDSGG
ncbi:alpha/beta fold hydrolase [Amycolatopsis sp. lyj-108]|uniref:alpha/beta fold hydrolase n=1 Tax=Amycolatopsis sp. lyj-108 TaxID=2789286 RepID=UPI0039789E0D